MRKCLLIKNVMVCFLAGFITLHLLFQAAHTKSIAPAITQTKEVVLLALEKELARNIEKLRMENQEPPYFILYRIKRNNSTVITATQGALKQSEENQSSSLYAQVRVGSYVMDNTGLDDQDKYYRWDEEWQERGHYSWMQAPLDGDVYALRHSLWQLTDHHYKQAIRDFLEHKAKAIFQVEGKEVPVDDFSKEGVLSHLEEKATLALDKTAWEEKIKNYSRQLHSDDLFLESQVILLCHSEHLYLAHSEGTRVQTGRPLCVLALEAFTRASDGMPLASQRLFSASRPDDLPGESVILSAISDLQKEIQALKESEIVESASIPVLFTGNAAPLILHELVGHNLEGRKENLEKGFEPGAQILPPFFKVYDDPSAAAVGGQALAGFYLVDDEGIYGGDNALLVEKGIIKNLLLARKPVKGFKNSNGHGRASWKNAEPRTGNLFVEAEKTVSPAQLKKMLIEECKKKKKPYGIMITSALTKESLFSLYPLSSGYSYYGSRKKGEILPLNILPVTMIKVWAKDGKEEVVHGAKIVAGSPKEFLSRIVAASSETFVANQQCSIPHEDMVPTATVAPAFLVSEVEIQVDKSGIRKLPVLHPPK